MPDPLPALPVVRQALADAVAGERSVQAAYVFGSVTRGSAGPLSDVDVALLVAVDADDQAVCDRVSEHLSRALRTARIDVVSLPSAPTPLAYRIVREGVLVVSRDARRLERFVTDTVLHYLDFQPLRERAFRVQRDAVLGHGR